MADIRELVFAPGKRDVRRRGRGPRGFVPRRRRSIGESPWTLAALAGAALGLWGEPLLQDAPWQGPEAWNRTGTERPGQSVPGRFALCHTGGGRDCVVDGDTFHMGGEKIRIADVDTPETHPPRCAEEARLGRAATLRLQALLDAGPFELEPIDRDEDRYGRKLRVVTRGGESLGSRLVAEGLARPYGDGRRSWCPSA